MIRLPRILGIVEPENTRSIRVLLKLGMTFQRETTWHGKPIAVYVIDLPVPPAP